MTVGRSLVLSMLVFVAVGCGTQTTSADSSPQDQLPRGDSTLERAAQELLPASYSVARAATHVGRCTFPRGSARCANLHARTEGSLTGRDDAVVRAARSHGWTLVSSTAPSGGSPELVFRRGGLNGRVILAARGPVAIVTVTTGSLAPLEPSLFAETVLVDCRRFESDVARIPRSLPRAEGIARFHAAWHALVVRLERRTPPAGEAAEYRALLAALREFDAALEPKRSDRLNAAAVEVERRFRAFGLEECIPD